MEVDVVPFQQSWRSKTTTVFHADFARLFTALTSKRD
jgi:hypothetical protein